MLAGFRWINGSRSRCAEKRFLRLGFGKGSNWDRRRGRLIFRRIFADGLDLGGVSLQRFRRYNRNDDRKPHEASNQVETNRVNWRGRPRTGPKHIISFRGHCKKSVQLIDRFAAAVKRIPPFL
jgi:hypothetical protein